MNIKEVSKVSPSGEPARMTRPDGVWRGKLEVIGFTIEGCAIAQSAGVHRIELCDNPADGGTTPSFGFIKAARKILQIELYNMIRPRGGDFFYSNDEFEIMKEDIKISKQLGCDGIVLGMLTKENKVDKSRFARLVELAYPLGVTFHRAFDRTADPLDALKDIIDMGCERILTSGQKPNALEGAQLIKQLIERADDKITIMPGAGVRSDNIINLAEITNASEFHSSARINTGENISVDRKEIEEMLKKLASVQ
ncbi:MAG TPA: copper homeostasis protein CutC [Chitinophagaceae bacterium]|nr:copper homeostasis protein CutC [Chitinophagaceae bacterium]